jgi:hypothetical protein
MITANRRFTSPTHKRDRALRLLEQHRKRSRTFLAVRLDPGERPG